MEELSVWLRQRIRVARVARLATVRPDGAPHVVPVTFALVGDDIVTAVGHKPKRTRDLQRLRNVAADPRVAVLLDHYDDDWRRLWWARADGTARVVPAADAPEALEALALRYRQYADRPPDGPVVVVAVDRWRGWSADQPSSSTS